MESETIIMARVLASEVKEILDTDLSDVIVGTFITAANITVTKFLGTSTVLSSVQLKEIERWFSAHLIACTREQQAQAEEVAGETNIKYQGKTGMGLDSTLYGQQVKVLDTSGVLAANLGKKKATIYTVTSFD